MNYCVERNKAVPFEVHNTCATAQEKQRARQFYETLLQNPAEFPCSFQLDGKPYHGFQEGFTKVSHTDSRQGEKQTDELVFRHESGLVFRALCAFYPAYAAFEWTLYLKNEAAQESARISELRAADVTFSQGNARLCGILGDARNEDYGDGDGVLSPTYGMNNQPYDVSLARGVAYELKNKGGCGSNHEFPYFRLQLPQNGCIIALGWPGQWTARFLTTPEKTDFCAGQRYLNATLHPQEEIRTPLVSFLLYDGEDEDRQTNLWRHFFMDCNMPRQHGFISQPTVGGTAIDTELMVNLDEKRTIDCLSSCRENGIHLDNWWMDAGWYTTDVEGTGPTELNDYGLTGTWQVWEGGYPTRFKAISDYAAQDGTKTQLWFEPERCGLNPETLKEDGSTLKKEWLLKDCLEFHLQRKDGTDWVMPFTFVNMGNPEAREWLRDRIIRVMEEGGISVYREDHNIRPLDAWLKTDEKGRLGLTENHYITGHLQLWDELREHFDGMIIDSCASGGRRDDLESMRRGVPLTNSDFFIYDLTKRQAVHHSLFRWFPYLKASGVQKGVLDDNFFYEMRSSLAPFTRILVKEGQMQGELAAYTRRYLEEWRSVNTLFYADYYPIVPWNIDEASWLGYEFVDSALGEAFVQLYRRPMAAENTCTVLLKGLQEEDCYWVRDLGENTQTQHTGCSLMQEGLTVKIEAQPGAATLKISRKKS